MLVYMSAHCNACTARSKPCRAQHQLRILSGTTYLQVWSRVPM